MIPDLLEIPGAPFRVLPPGIHLGSMEEVGVRFATNEQRLKLYEGFISAAAALQIAGCQRLYLDGSFTTDKPLPQDYDGCWDPRGVDLDKLDPVFLDFSKNRAAQKKKYLGEMFIATLFDLSGVTFLEFFQTEKNTGERKGIVEINALVDESSS